jgi:hypothetical protein
MTLKTMTPKKLAAIVVVSAEVVRADPGGYVTNLRGQLAEAFAIAFDYAEPPQPRRRRHRHRPVRHLHRPDHQDRRVRRQRQANGGVYVDLVDAIDELISDTDATGRRYRATGFALDSQVETRLRRAVDTTGRPIWVDLPTDAESAGLTSPGTLLNRRSFMGEGVADPANHILGYVGEWSQAAWGVVGGISYDVSTEATVTINGTLTSLWEHNLVAIRAEAEYGFLVNDVDAFVQLRNDTGS